MSPDIYGSQAAWPWADSPLAPTTSWHELQRLAERADVSVEALCEVVETAKHFNKATSIPSDNDDLEAVISVLADDDFDFDDLSLESKAVWNEADHPRDDAGRFTNGQHLIPLERRPTSKEENSTRSELNYLHTAAQKSIPA